MRYVTFAFALALSVGVLSTSVLRGAPPTGSVTPGPNRTMAVCVNDPEDPPGTPETIELFVGHANWPYDRFTLADGSCTTRGYAPFGPSLDPSGGHSIGVRATDSTGQSAWLLFGALLTETCNAWPAGDTNRDFCNAHPSHYSQRQANTWPMVSDHVWAGVNKALGGAIQQLYSADRSFNLLMEHPGGAMQLSLWSGDAIGPPVPDPSLTCVGSAVLPREMNILQTSGPECTSSHPAHPDLSSYTGPTGSALVNTIDADNHKRKWTIPNFRIGQQTFIRSDHLEVNYRFINWSQWGFTLADQEIPSVHLNYGMNDAFYFGTGGYGVDQFVPHGAENQKAILYVQAIGPPPNAGAYGEPKLWNGSWVSACNAANRCVTIAPHDPPSTAGIHMAQIFSNVLRHPLLLEGANMVAMLGRFAITQGMDKSIRVYVFPYRYDTVINGVSVRDRLLQLRGWL